MRPPEARDSSFKSPGLPPGEANPAALTMAQVLAQLLEESKFEGHLDETWRVLDFCWNKKNIWMSQEVKTR